MTNGDKIRQMTDAELAMFLREFDRCIVCQIVCTKEYRCDKGIIAWLKQEYKDADND